MFDVFYIGPKPNLFAHEREVSSVEQAQVESCTRYCWIVNYLSDYTDFDFLWEPSPWQTEFTHVWPSQWHEYSGTYLVPKTGEINFHFHKQVIPNSSDRRQYKQLVDGLDFDYTWAPHPMDPPYIYVFGNQWHCAEIMPTLEYTVPGATERKYMHQPRVTLRERHDNHWHTLKDCIFDYSWRPDPGDPLYIYVFGNQWHSAEIMPTVEYHMPGATERKFVYYPRAELIVDETLWTVPDGIDKTTVDFTWQPDPGSPPYIYQFGTQHQRTGGPKYTVPGATEVKYVGQIRAITNRVATAIYEIDHLDGNAGQIPNTTKTARYFDNYLDTLRRIAKTVPDEHEFVWICSSVCDYTDFDFSWHPEQWQATMLHVFPSSGEKFGDTFFMHVPSFKYRSEKCQLLEWYDLNFTDKSVPRRSLPVIKHSDDTHVDAIKTQPWAGPLAVFTNQPAEIRDIPCVPLWREKTKTIVTLSSGAGTVIVPRVAVPYIKTQAYDYAHINRKQRHMYDDQPLDIVFISNGEVNADYNYEKLKFYVGDRNRVQRVDRVNGRVAAYHAAANASRTPWFFAVFAKLEVNPDFDWFWQPDRLQQAKHYIFHARNPVNGLEYGHQAMIAYNKRLTLANQGQGLDFTLDSEHEVVPILSGTAHYNTDAWTCWRTAFRECIKLRAATDVESQYRLRQWLKPCPDGQRIVNDEWSVRGAEDAVEYYESVNGDFSELRKSYDWAWLASYAFVKHSLTQNQ